VYYAWQAVIYVWPAGAMTRFSLRLTATKGALELTVKRSYAEVAEAPLALSLEGHHVESASLQTGRMEQQHELDMTKVNRSDTGEGSVVLSFALEPV